MADAPHRTRDLSPGATYHVYNRGANRAAIFRSRDDYDRFLHGFWRLLEYLPRNKGAHPGVKVIAYALMPNHFHVVLRQGQDPVAISRFMARLTTGYTMYFNKKYGRRGKLYEGRFHAKLLADTQAMRDCIVYVHRNPDRPLAAGAVTSHALYTGRRRNRAAHWCHADLGLELFAGRASYVEYLHDAIANRENGADPQPAA